jgi:hypothetical protein
MCPAPIGTSARQIRFESGKSASAGRLDESMRIAVLANEQSLRNHCPEHRENRIPAFSAEGSGKAGFRQIPSGIERDRHSAGSWLDRAILSNRDIPGWAIDANSKLAGGAPGLG